MSKLVLAVIISIIMTFMMVTETECEDIEVVNILPSIKELTDEEIARIQEEKVKSELEEIRNRDNEERRMKEIVSRGSDRGIFTITSYDLTVASCGKPISHPAYGITKSGYSLVGQDRESAMTIATDPKIIPLGTKVHIEFFDEEWQHWSGIYTSRDTGSAIKGKRIDLFYKDTGDSNTDQIVWDFGKRKAKITIIE